MLVLLPANAIAESALISEIRYLDQQKPATIQIEFATPVQFLSYIPKDKSDILLVNLRLRDARDALPLQLDQIKKAGMSVEEFLKYYK